MNLFTYKKKTVIYNICICVFLIKKYTGYISYFGKIK